MAVAVLYSYEKGLTPAGYVTATVIDENHNALDTKIHGTVSIQSADVLDYNDDPSGDAAWTSITGIVLPGPSGAVIGGTAANPIRVDPTGTTVQPIGGIAKGGTSALGATCTAAGADHNNQDAILRDSSGNEVGTVSKPFRVSPANPTMTASDKRILAAAADTQLWAANASRGSVAITNETTGICYVLYGSGAASATNYRRQIPSGAAIEIPGSEWPGELRMYCSTADGHYIATTETTLT